MTHHRRNIGLLGGTFDPVHVGHLIVAGAVHEKMALDRVVFIPAARPPHKGTELMFTPEERFGMLSLAVKGDPRFEVSDVELRREGPSYTIDTVRELKRNAPPETSFSFIVGKDNLTEMPFWKDPEELLGECRLLAVSRVHNGELIVPDWLREKVEHVEVPLIQVSSSDIRRRLREGKSIRYLVTDDVLAYIDGLHGASSG